MCGKHAHFAISHLVASIVSFQTFRFKMCGIHQNQNRRHIQKSKHVKPSFLSPFVFILYDIYILWYHGCIFVKLTMTKYCIMGNYFLCRTNTSLPHSRDSLVFCLQRGLCRHRTNAFIHCILPTKLGTIATVLVQ